METKLANSIQQIEQEQQNEKEQELKLELDEEINQILANLSIKIIGNILYVNIGEQQFE